MNNKRWELTQRLLLMTLVVSILSVMTVILVWTSSCSIPTDILLSEKFVELISQNDHSEDELVQLVYDEIHRQLYWHGESDVEYVSFEYICNSNNCTLNSAEINIRIKHFTLCRFDRRTPESIATVDINFRQFQITSNLYPMRWGTSYQTSWSDISSKVIHIKDSTISSLSRDIWDKYSSFFLRIRRGLDSWEIEILETDNTLIHEIEVDYLLNDQ